MEEFNALKTEIQSNKKTLDEASATVAALNQKLAEIKEKLAESEQHLCDAMYAMETAVAKFARSEIDETALDGFQARVNAGRVKRDTFSKALEGAEKEIAGAVCDMKEIVGNLREKERYAWIQIGKIELEKAAKYLSRAFVAFCRGDVCISDMRGGADTKFLNFQVREAFLSEMKNRETIASNLSREYFN